MSPNTASPRAFFHRVVQAAEAVPSQLFGDGMRGEGLFLLLVPYLFDP